MPQSSVTVDLKARDRLKAGLATAQGRIRSFARRVGSGFTEMTRAVFNFKNLLIGSASVALVGYFAKAAANAEEAASKFRAVFRDQADEANAWSRDLGKSVNRSSAEIRDGMSTFMSFFVGLGTGTEEARKLAQRVQGLSVDFASFHNLTDPDALNRFTMGLSGSAEVFSKFGINVKDSAIAQELLRMGINKAAKEITNEEKVMARLSIITRSMTEQGALGDAERTAGSFTNVMKGLRGQLAELVVGVGTAMLPALKKLAEGFSKAAEWAENNMPKIQGAIGGTVAVMQSAFKFVSDMLSDLGSVMRSGWKMVFSYIGSLLEPFVADWGEVFSTIRKYLNAMLGSWKGWSAGMMNVYTQVIAAFEALWETYQHNWINNVGIMKLNFVDMWYEASEKAVEVMMPVWSRFFMWLEKKQQGDKWKLSPEEENRVIEEDKNNVLDSIRNKRNMAYDKNRASVEEEKKRHQDRMGAIGKDSLDAQKKFEDLMKKLPTLTGKFRAGWNAAQPGDVPEMPGLEGGGGFGAGGLEGKAKVPTFETAEQVWKRRTAAAFKKSDDPQEKILVEAQKQVKVQEKMEKHLENIDKGQNDPNQKLGDVWAGFDLIGEA